MPYYVSSMTVDSSGQSLLVVATFAHNPTIASQMSRLATWLAHNITILSPESTCMRIRLTQCASGSRFDMQTVHAALVYHHTKDIALSKTWVVTTFHS